MAMNHSVYTDCEFCGALRSADEADIGGLVFCKACEKEFEVPDPTLLGTCTKCDDRFLICGNAGEKVGCRECNAPIRFENIDLKEIKNPLKYGPKPGKDADDEKAAMSGFDPRNLVPLLALLLVGLGAWWFLKGNSDPAPPPPAVASVPSPETNPVDPANPPTPNPPPAAPTESTTTASAPTPADPAATPSQTGPGTPPPASGEPTAITAANFEKMLQGLDAELTEMSRPFDEALLAAHAPDMGPAIQKRQSDLKALRTTRNTKAQEFSGGDARATTAYENLARAMEEHELMATTLVAAREIARATGKSFRNDVYPNQTIDVRMPPNIDEQQVQRLWTTDHFRDATDNTTGKIRIKDIIGSMPDRIEEALVDYRDTLPNLEPFPAQKIRSAVGDGQLSLAALALGGPEARPTATVDVDATHKAYRAAVQRIRANKFSRPAASWFVANHSTNPAANDKRLVNLLRGIYDLPGDQEHVHSECVRCRSAQALDTACIACGGAKICAKCEGAGSQVMRSFSGEKVRACIHCRGTGACVACRGAGERAAAPCSLCNGEVTYVDKGKMAAEIKALTDKIIRRETAFIKGKSQSGF